jgi:hypothetical protein
MASRHRHQVAAGSVQDGLICLVQIGNEMKTFVSGENRI